MHWQICLYLDSNIDNFDHPSEVFLAKVYGLLNQDPTEFYTKMLNQNLANEQTKQFTYCAGR